MSTSNNAAFNAVFFSTNLSTFGLQSITELYFKETHCKNLSQKKKNFQVKFIRKLNENKFSFETFGTFYEQNYVYDNPKILEEVDCYIIIFDLEFNDSLVELNKITGFLSDKCDGEKNIYLITIYKNQNDIKKDFTEKNIKYYFSKYFLENYDFDIVNIDSTNELVKKIDEIIIESLKNKGLDGGVDNLDTDKSNSRCKIY